MIAYYPGYLNNCTAAIVPYYGFEKICVIIIIKENQQNEM